MERMTHPFEGKGLGLQFRRRWLYINQFWNPEGMVAFFITATEV
jgi:hypothetical protein